MSQTFTSFQNLVSLKTHLDINLNLFLRLNEMNY